MYAFSLVNSINKIMKTPIIFFFINLVCFYDVILHLETIDLE